MRNQRFVTLRVVGITVAAMALAACDHTVEPEPAPPPQEPTMATPDQIATYRGLVDALDEATQNYQFAILDRGLTQASCRSAQARYDTVARPSIERMMGLGDELDTFMDAHEGGFVADMACVPRLMMFELDNHNHVACMWPTAERNRTEALRHASVMTEYIEHVDTRVEEMTAGMGGGAWSWQDSMCN